jgi:hypothetical protein
VIIVVPSNLFHLFDCLSEAAKNAKSRKGFRLVWHSVIWCIWKARNDCIFNNVRKELSEVVEEIKVLSWRWSAARLKIPSVFITNGLGILEIVLIGKFLWVLLGLDSFLRCCCFMFCSRCFVLVVCLVCSGSGLSVPSQLLLLQFFLFYWSVCVGWWVAYLVTCHSLSLCNLAPSPDTSHTMVFEVLIKFGFSKKIK